MIKLFALVVASVVFFPNNVTLAQKISINGSVRDSLTNQPLPYANISVKNSNYGTVTNSEGEFQLKIDSSFQVLVISYIGYETKTIPVNKSQKLDILLKSRSIELAEVIVDPYTWAERFILKAIEKKNEIIEKINNYTSDAYSKTSFAHGEIGVLGLVESVSKINFFKPDFFQEKVLVYKASQNLKNIPYHEIAVNQSINLLNNSSRIGNFSITSPLNDDALDYYEFNLKNKNLLDNDTVVVITVKPKQDNIPLFHGDLFFFQENHQLIEAQLIGNSAAKDGFMDSIRVFQKFSIKDSVYNLPAFTRYSVVYSFYGFDMKYAQEYTFINYEINNGNDGIIYSTNNILFDESNLTFDIDFKRNEEFKVPLSEEEIKFNEKMEKVFNESSIFRRFFLYFFTDIFPAFLDRPVTLFGLNFTRFSNLYSFNKVEGHFLGFEYQFVNDADLNATSKIGYAFSPKLFEYDLYIRYKNVSFNIGRSINTLGHFNYLKSLQTLNALLYHEDDLHYYKSIFYNLRYQSQFNSKFSITPFIEFEKQAPISNESEFGLFNREKKYSPNYSITGYNNNSAGIILSYVENKDFLTEEMRIYKGESFTNILCKVNFHNKSLLHSTEDITEWNLMFNRYQEICTPFSVNIEMNLRYLTGNKYLNKMEFVNDADLLSLRNTPLTFYTLNSYQYYMQNYLKIKSDVTFFNFPEIFGSIMSFSGTFVFLRPLNHKILSVPFNSLDKNFYEYGLTLKGVGILNLSLLKNNIDKKRLFFRIDFSL